MKTIWIAPTRWKRVDNQHVNPLLDEIAGLVDKFLQRLSARFVAGRHNFDQGNESISADVANGDRTLFRR